MAIIIEEATDAEKSIFKKKLKKITQFKGSGTELISLYLPPDADRSSVTGQLTEEMSQSSNIKDQKTRKNVQGALKRIINFLKQIDFELPKKGMVIFSGNISKTEGKTDIKLFTIIPVKKLETKLYWCDSSFHLAPLEQMIIPSELYGIITLDKNEATIALLKGKKFEIVGNFKSRVAGKTRAGGQSAHRFEHLREEARHNFFKEVAEQVNKSFLQYEDKLTGVIMAGPGITKNFFLGEELLDHRIAKKIIGKVDTSYTDESGIKEALDKSGDILQGVGIIREKKIIQDFLKHIVKDGLASYGFKEVETDLNTGKVDTLIISEGIDKIVYVYKKETGETFKEMVDFENLETYSHPNAELLEELDYADYLMEKAQNTGSKTFIVSVDTDEGKQFLNGFGGVGAILRYK